MRRYSFPLLFSFNIIFISSSFYSSAYICTSFLSQFPLKYLICCFPSHSILFFFILTLFLYIHTISHFSVHFRFYIHNYRWSNFYYFGVNFPFVCYLDECVCKCVFVCVPVHIFSLTFCAKFQFFFLFNGFFCIVMPADSNFLLFLIHLSTLCLFIFILHYVNDWYQLVDLTLFSLIKCCFYSIATADFSVQRSA